MFKITYRSAYNVVETAQRMDGLLPADRLEVRVVGKAIKIKTPHLEQTLKALRDEFEITTVTVSVLS